MAQQRRSRMTVGVLVLLACLLVPRIASAQFDAATVLGTVIDATGARVPGATVTLKNADTGITATTVTDGEGNYQFLNVRIGTYSIRAELQGFSAAVAENGRRDRQRPPARRSDDEGRRHRRNGRRHRRRAAARERIERSRPGHRPRADRQPAAQRPRLRRPRAAQPRRPQVVDQRVSRWLVQRQRPAQLAQQLHPRRRRQQLLRHEQPGLLEPGRAGVARRGRGVQGPDQQLQRRVRPRRRRRHQRDVPQRHESVSRHRLGVQSQHVAERDRLLQALVRRQADARPQPVRRRVRRARSSRTAPSSSPTTRASARCSGR